MPIQPENVDRYPINWKEISLQVRTEAGWICEWCGSVQGKPNPVTGSKVVLTVAHLNHTPEDCRRENLAALCQRCHLNYDRHIHAANRQKNAEKRREAARIAAGQLRLL